MTNERSSEAAKLRTNADRTGVIVFVILAANAITAFAIQAWMTYGFAAKVWKLPTELCFALIVALDIFAIMYMVLMYLLRSTGWPRVFATGVFLFAIGAQVFAAELYGAHENWTTEVRWFAVFPALALALSQEGAILWRIHRNDAPRDRRPSPPPAEPSKRPAAAAQPDAPAPAAAPPVDVRKERPMPGKTQVRAAHPARKVSAGKTERRDSAVGRVLAGEAAKDVAASIGVSRRAVEIWVRDHRATSDAAPEPKRLVGIAALPTDLTSTNTRPINGAAPEVSVNR
jgi:type IV secretory pathway TrbD component